MEIRYIYKNVDMIIIMIYEITSSSFVVTKPYKVICHLIIRILYLYLLSFLIDGILCILSIS